MCAEHSRFLWSLRNASLSLGFGLSECSFLRRSVGEKVSWRHNGRPAEERRKMTCLQAWFKLGQLQVMELSKRETRWAFPVHPRTMNTELRVVFMRQKGWVDERLCLPVPMKRVIIVATETVKVELWIVNGEKVVQMLHSSKMEKCDVKIDEHDSWEERKSWRWFCTSASDGLCHSDTETPTDPTVELCQWLMTSAAGLGRVQFRWHRNTNGFYRWAVPMVDELSSRIR